MKKNLLKNFIIAVTCLFAISALAHLAFIFVLPDVEINLYFPGTDTEYIVGDYVIFFGLILDIVVLMTGFKIIRNLK